MKIKIANLSDGVHYFTFNEEINVVGLDEPFYNKFTAEIELSKTHSQIVLDAQIKLNAKFDCDRCSSNYAAVLNTSYKMVYLFSSEPEDSEAIDIKYLPFEAVSIDIADDVRDYALLAVPMKKICKEDCKGLCFKCGKDLNEGECGCSAEKIDERWLPLLELKSKLNIN